MSSSRESSCSTDSSLAEQQFAEVHEHQQREALYNKTNTEHSAHLSAIRMESNCRLAQFGIPPTLPTSRTETMKLLEQLQGVSSNIVEIGKAQVDMAARFLKCLRHARLIRNRLQSIGVGRDTHGLVYTNQDELIRAVTRNGCNRALRIFERQSLHRAAPKTEGNARILKAIAPAPRKPRAKKAKVEEKPVVALTRALTAEEVLAEF